MSLNSVIKNNKYGVKIPTPKYHHNYLPVYERLFDPYKEHINLLEIGILDGASLALWQEFFESYIITGIEILPDFVLRPGVPPYEMPWTKNLIDDPNVNLIWNTDATQPATIAVKQIADYNIIIDDSNDNIKTVFEIFKNYWPLLAVGGTYIMEDSFRRETAEAGKLIVNNILKNNSFQIDTIEIDNQERILFTVTKLD